MSLPKVFYVFWYFLIISLYENLYGESVIWTLNSHVKTVYVYKCLLLCSDSKQAAMLKKDETECQRKIEEGQARRKMAAKYLKETIKR